MSNNRIVSLQVENIMRIRAASVTPDKNLVVVGGKNGNGKTCLMQSIAMAMGGKDEIPPEPLRQGEEKGKIVVELDDLIVTRLFTAKGTTLKVAGKDGANYSSPQKILDDMRGKLTFDPLAFLRMDSKKQAETLRVLAGLNFGAADEARAEYYTERTAANRNVKSAKARLDSLPQHDDVPAEEISIVKITDDLEVAEGTNRQNVKKIEILEKTETEIQVLDREMGMLKEKIERLKDEIALHTQQRDKFVARRSIEIRTVEALQDVSTSDIKQQIRDAEGTNNKVRENAARAKALEEYEYHDNEAAGLTQNIERIDADKRKKLREAKLPIDGLGLGLDGVTFGGLPFSQCSSAEQLRISVAMGMAMNPTLRILMIRDGSLLDDDSLAAIDKMAKEGDYQIWLEVVTDDPSKATVYIEDGMVKESALEEAAQ